MKKGSKKKSSASKSPAPKKGAVESHVDPEQFLKASRSLLAFVARKQEESGDLLAGEETVLVVFGLQKIPNDATPIPIPIPLVHPLHSKPKVCFFAAGSGGKARKILNARGVQMKVMGVDKLRGKYRPYEMRRKLAGSYDYFVCEEDILNQLRTVLGKIFFHRKKFPTPVKLDDKVAATLKALESTAFLTPSRGPTWVLKVGTTASDAKAVAENAINAVATVVAKHIPGGWANIRGLHLKSDTSLALPVFSQLPEVGLQVEGAEARPVSEKRRDGFAVDEDEENAELLQLARDAELLDEDEEFEFDASGSDVDDLDDSEEKEERRRKKEKKRERAAPAHVAAAEPVAEPKKKSKTSGQKKKKGKK